MSQNSSLFPKCQAASKLQETVRLPEGRPVCHSLYEVPGRTCCSHEVLGALTQRLGGLILVTVESCHMGGWDFGQLRKYGGLQDGDLASRMGWRPGHSCPGRRVRFLLVVLSCAPLRWDFLTDLAAVARCLQQAGGLLFSWGVQGRLPLAGQSILQISASSQSRHKLQATWKRYPTLFPVWWSFTKAEL